MFVTQLSLRLLVAGVLTATDRATSALELEIQPISTGTRPQSSKPSSRSTARECNIHDPPSLPSPLSFHFIDCQM
uniref:Putative secreted protein n=1 Tax=Anopheles marajoara TaxID=58244 RepID=A0A2M4CCZ0_9DIPT